MEWLIDDDNRELADEIEEVNERMLERLLDESLYLAVLFCKKQAYCATVRDTIIIIFDFDFILDSCR